MQDSESELDCDAEAGGTLLHLCWLRVYTTQSDSRSMSTATFLVLPAFRLMSAKQEGSTQKGEVRIAKPIMVDLKEMQRMSLSKLLSARDSVGLRTAWHKRCRPRLC